MPFDSRELSVLAYANGFTLWHYRTADPATDLTLDPADRPAGAPYFAGADELLREGDQIIVNLQGGNRPAMVNLMVTAVEQPGRVAVAKI
jgi:hypothetical protein